MPVAALVVALAGCGGGVPAGPLPALDIDPDRVAVAGLSSGAYMATQVHFAFSDRLRGAALVAGGPYGCAGGDLDTALGPCMTGKPFVPDPERLAAAVRARAETGALAPLSGLDGDRVLVLHGARDTRVAPALAASSAGLYRELGGERLALRVDPEREFGHVFPTTASGVDCIAGGTPYLGACGFDAAGMIVDALFAETSALAEAVPRMATGELRTFAQHPLLGDEEPVGLADRGLLYVPTVCAQGAACGLLIVFHGCEQGIDAVGETFAREAGFNAHADRARLVVLYPQARSSLLPLNPKACWDWWGYTGPDYDTRAGLQLRWLANASAALGAPLTP